MIQPTLRGRLAHPNVWKGLVGFITLAAFLLPLALYSVVGLYTRYAADDYETAGSLNRYGFWGSQQYWYQHWSGRYTYFALVNLFEMLGVRAAPVLTFLCLALWMLATAWVLCQLLQRDSIQHPTFLAWLGAALILVVTLRSMNHIHQILFWVTGILTYMSYLVLFTFFVGFLICRLHRPYPDRIPWWEVIGVGVYTFILTGMSEMSASLQLLVAGLAMVAFLLWRSDPHKQRTGLVLSGAMLLATVVGFLILFAAPGNDVRATTASIRPDLWSLIWHANLNTLTFLATWLKNDTILAGVSFFLPALFAFVLYRPPLDPTQRLRREKLALYSLLISILLLYLATLSQFATAYYAISAMPPDRAQIIAQYLLTFFIVIWGYWGGSLPRGLLPVECPISGALKVVGGTLLGLMLLYGPVYASTCIYTMIAPARSRAIEWDERDQIIRQAVQAGERNVVVWYIQDLNRLGDYSSEPTFLVNRAAADYYGLDTIIALDERPQP